MKRWTIPLAPLALGGLLACGGHGDPLPPSNVLDGESAVALAAHFLNEENNQTGENDDSGPVAAGQAEGLAMPAHPTCVVPSAATPNSVTWTFNNCTGPHGWTWNGVVVITWGRNPDGSILVKHDQRHMVGTRNGKSWTLNGVKDILRDPATKIVRLSAEPGFTKAFNDGNSTTTYTYTCNLTADWATQGLRKLYGSWGMTPQGGGDAVSAVIATSTPLVWDRSADCCYPVSGTLNLTKGSRTAALVHALPCGTLTVNGEAKTLPPCSR
jgi:hypothetical protein